MVYGMYQTLQETDAKIGALHGEMRDMIVVLCECVVFGVRSNMR